MRVTNADAHIDVSVDGSGTRTVVLIHGFPLTREVWRAQVEPLATVARVVALDLRGIGKSSVPDGPYLMETLASDVAAVLDALGVERATLVGHSLGGYVALAFARMYVERLAALGLVASRLAADDAARREARMTLAAHTEQQGTMAAIVEEYLPALLASPSAASQSALASAVGRMASSSDPRGAAAMLRGMALRDAADDIAGDLTCPVSVVAGACDAGIPLEEARAVAAAFPHGELVVCTRSGHLPMLEEPAGVTEALVRLVETSG